jgi:hypothetical protein
MTIGTQTIRHLTSTSQSTHCDKRDSLTGCHPWPSPEIRGNLAVEGGDRVGGGFNRP